MARMSGGAALERTLAANRPALASVESAGVPSALTEASVRHKLGL